MRLINPFVNRPGALRNREAGRRLFVLANGPSVLQHDLSLLKGELVVGMNASTMLEEKYGFESKYYVLSDARFISSPEKRCWATEKLAHVTHRVVRSDLRSLDDPSLENRTTYVRPLSRDGFSRDLATGFHYGCTTTMLAVQLGWHLGAREVYLLGCDLRYPEEYPRFYKESVPQLEDAFTSVQISNIVNAAAVFEEAGGRIVNCGRRSFLRPYLHFDEFENVLEKSTL
jgi:hypothetical protein